MGFFILVTFVGCSPKLTESPSDRCAMAKKKSQNTINMSLIVNLRNLFLPSSHYKLICNYLTRELQCVIVSISHIFSQS